MKDRMKKNKVKTICYNLLMVVCAAAFLGSGGMLVRKLCEDKKQSDAFTRLTEVFPEAEGTENAGVQTERPLRWEPATGRISPDSLAELEESGWAEWEARLDGYERLRQQNSDFVGWIRIDKTPIDYPVMQTPDRPDYYLKRNFEKNSSAHGVPYVSELCVLGAEGTNLLIYGHHMKNGSMFASLDGYRDAEYYQEHPVIRFDTLEEASVYEVIGAWLIPNAASAEQVEELYRLIFPRNEEEFAAGWKAAGSRLFVKTDVVPSINRRLLALVTCDYSYNDSRIVVLAQQSAEQAESD